jgi:hypothetical protein
MARFSLIAITFAVLTLSASAWVIRGKPAMGGQEPIASPQPESCPMLPADIIDGAKHPELVPDLVAYRLYFVAVAEPIDATAEQKQRQRAFLKAAGIGDADLESAIAVLATFKKSYDDLVKRYNDSVDTANRAGTPPDLETFLSQQDALVESTRQALAAAIGAEKMSRVEARVQHEKTNMRVAKEDR